MRTPGTKEQGREEREGSPRRPVADPSPGFIMLGVIHRDPDGPTLLDRWLNTVAPEVITVEFSDYGRTFRARMGSSYRKQVEEVYNRLKKADLPCYDNALSVALSYVEMPYELEGASRYGMMHGVPVYCIDMDFFSYLRLREIETLLSPENLEKLLSVEGGKGGGYENVLARLYFGKVVKTVPYTEEMCVRDQYMSNRIKVLKERYKGKRLLHISGWRHLHDPRSFYAPLNPVKVFIYDKTVCF